MLQTQYRKIIDKLSFQKSIGFNISFALAIAKCKRTLKDNSTR